MFKDAFVAALASKSEAIESITSDQWDSLFVQTLRETFLRLDAAYRERPRTMSGACLICCCITEESVYTANVGDCRAVLGRLSGDGLVCVCVCVLGFQNTMSIVGMIIFPIFLSFHSR